MNFSLRIVLIIGLSIIAQSNSNSFDPTKQSQYFAVVVSESLGSAVGVDMSEMEAVKALNCRPGYNGAKGSDFISSFVKCKPKFKVRECVYLCMWRDMGWISPKTAKPVRQALAKSMNAVYGGENENSIAATADFISCYREQTPKPTFRQSETCEDSKTFADCYVARATGTCKGPAESKADNVAEYNEE